MVASIASISSQIKPKNRRLQFGNKKVGLLIDSGVKEPLATKIINNPSLAGCLTTVPPKDYKTFANESIFVIDAV